MGPGIRPMGANFSGFAGLRCALSVMAGLVPAIPIERRWSVLKVGHLSKAGMPGIRPGMTERIVEASGASYPGAFGRFG